MPTLDEIQTVGYVMTCGRGRGREFLGRDDRGAMATGYPCKVKTISNARIASTPRAAELWYKDDQEVLAKIGKRLPKMEVMKVVLMPNEMIPF